MRLRINKINYDTTHITINFNRAIYNLFGIGKRSLKENLDLENLGRQN